MIVDWSNPTSAVSEWFSVRECLYLPTWGRLAVEADGLNDTIKSNLTLLCLKLDYLRNFFQAPMVIHCMYRPPEYSHLVGGSMTDVHTKGMAADFHVEKITCDEAKKLIIPSLSSLGIRLENNPGGNWLHVDTHPPGVSGSFFNP